MRVLVMIQLRNLDSLLSRLDDIVALYSLDSHREILNSINMRFRATAVVMRRLEIAHKSRI